MAASSPRILVVYTGGTLGMVESEEGYVPGSGTLEALMEERLSFQSEDLPAYDVHAFDPLLDSANMEPADWLRIAEAIRDRFEAYDGFLVVHGTDTMAFTASALSFMLHPLDKPVLLTGAQLPLDETRSDAQGNLLTSLLLLGTYPDRLGGVHVFFHNRLYRGTRVTKVNADSFAAFDSPNFPAVGTAGIDLDVEWERVPAPHRPPRVPSRRSGSFRASGWPLWKTCWPRRCRALCWSASGRAMRRPRTTRFWKPCARRRRGASSSWR